MAIYMWREIYDYTISNIPTNDNNVYVNVVQSGEIINSVKFTFDCLLPSSGNGYVHISSNNSNTQRYGIVLNPDGSILVRGRTSGSDTIYRTLSGVMSSSGTCIFEINRDGNCSITYNGTTYTWTATGAELTVIQTIMNFSDMNVYVSQSGSWYSGNSVGVGVTYLSGRLAYYTFNGNATDQTGNGYNGTRGNGGHYATGFDGNQCADFSRANNDWITVSSLTAKPSTVAFFMKWCDLNATSQDWRQVIGQTSSWANSWCIRAIPITTSGTLRGYYCFYCSGGNAEINNASLVDTNWHHYCLTSDGTTTYFYMDGNLIMSKSGQLTTNGSLKISRIPGSGEYALNGYMQYLILDLDYWSQQDLQNYLSDYNY